MKVCILFRAGHSGNYIQSLIEDKPIDVQFRIDPYNPQLTKELLESDISYINDNQCVLLHTVPSREFLKKFDLVLRILPTKNLYNPIYNNFHKKILVEEPIGKDFLQWKDCLTFWYDKTFYNISEQYAHIVNDMQHNQIENVIDFDRILNIDYIEYIFQKYFNRSVTDNMKNIVDKYKHLQLGFALTDSGLTMHDITKIFHDDMFFHDPWFASYCIFKFEKNNNLNESQRQWSIGDFLIDKKFLLSIQHMYNR